MSLFVFGEDDAAEAVGSRSVGYWLLGLFAIALLIRITQLTAKPAWMDEVSTVMFSLGNYSRLIPTDQLISLQQVTRGLQLTPGTTAMDAATNLLAENNHPPAYFMLAHGWMMGFHWLTGRTAEGAYASLWAARSLSALFGALAVPVTYWLAWVSFRDRLTALLCAALMAVSPFSVFLSQEARHYTLAILLVMGSLGCFVLAVQALRQGILLRWRTVLGWVAVNGFGIAVHYFCAIAYLAQALVLLWLLLQQCARDGGAWRSAFWLRIYAVAAGTAAGILVWMPVLLHFYGSPQTTYITSSSRSIDFWIRPVAQSVVGWLYALMSPISRGFSWQWVVVIVVTSAFLLLCYAPWLGWQLGRSLQLQWTQHKAPTYHRSGLLALGGFFVAANLIYFAICYVVGFDITRGHRYTFAYYPSLIVLAGAGLTPFLSGQISARLPGGKRFFGARALNGRTFVAVVLLMAFLGTQTIVFNRSHLKFYMAERFVDAMQRSSEYPAILSMQVVVGNQPSVIGNEIVSAAWEMHRQLEKSPSEKSPSEWKGGEPRFVLLEKNVVTDNNPVETLKAVTEPVPGPFDLWILNGSSPISEPLDPVVSECLAPAIGPEEGNEGSFAFYHYVCGK